MSEVQPGAEASVEPSSPDEAAQAVIDSVDDAGNSQSGNVDAGSSEELDAADASDAELNEVLDDDNASESDKEEAAAELHKRLSLKINGQDEEFDLGNDDHIKRLKEMAQKGEGADQKFRESAQLRKQMEQFVQLMQQDPIRALQELGHNPDDIAEAHMKRRLEEMQLSPEQKRLKELEDKLAKEESERKKLEDERFEERQMRAQQEYERELKSEISRELADSNLPESQGVTRRIAEVMMGLLDEAEANRQEGEELPEIRVKDVLPIVEKQIRSEIQELFAAMPEKVIEEMLGNDVSNKMRKYRRSKIKDVPQTASSVKSTGKAEQKAAAAAAKPAEPKSAKDFFKDLSDY